MRCSAPPSPSAATAEVVPWLGATPRVRRRPARHLWDGRRPPGGSPSRRWRPLGRLKPRAVIAVDLFGQPADYPAISAVARARGLKLIADSAQGFGCTLEGRHPLSWSDWRDHQLLPRQAAGRLRGRRRGADRRRGAARGAWSRCATTAPGADKYDNVRIGMNSRLDTIQAAILLEKLAVFPRGDRLAQRRGRPLRRAPRRRRHHAHGDRGRGLHLGAVHGPRPQTATA